MRFLAVVLAAVGTVTAMNCTNEGASWTPEEFAEYLTLDDTTDWAPMARIQQCAIEDSDWKPATPSHPHDTRSLEARGGNNRWSGYKYEGCNSGEQIVTAENFGCGGCYFSADAIKSGYLWRERLSGSYPTVDYFNGPNCSGKKLHHQGISSFQYSSCNTIPNTAWSAVVYQGC